MKYIMKSKNKNLSKRIFSIFMNPHWSNHTGYEKGYTVKTIAQLVYHKEKISWEEKQSVSVNLCYVKNPISKFYLPLICTKGSEGWRHYFGKTGIEFLKYKELTVSKVNGTLTNMKARLKDGGNLLTGTFTAELPSPKKRKGDSE